MQRSVEIHYDKRPRKIVWTTVERRTPSGQLLSTSHTVNIDLMKINKINI